MDMITSMPADEALRILLEGNRRFAEDEMIHYDELHQIRKKTVNYQDPIAVIIGCSDSRVPLEIVFHQKLGDLFVIRVAGNVINPDIIGSVEYAVRYLKVNLVMVLGHTSCGAVSAALSGKQFSDELKGLIDKITLAEDDGKMTETELLESSVRSNVENVVKELRGLSAHFINKPTRRKLKIVGAYYKLDSGRVEVMDV